MAKLEKNIGLLMRIGVGVSAMIMLAGLILLFIKGELGIDFMSGPLNIQEVMSGLGQLKAGSFMALGVFCLMLTPILRVLASIVTFAIERDAIYVVITLLVLVILIVCFFLGFLLKS